MSQKKSTKKSVLRSLRGHLSLQIRNSKQEKHPGWLRVNVPASLRASGKQEYFMLEQPATPEIQAAVHGILNKINAEIHILGSLNITAWSKEDLKDLILSQLKGEKKQSKSGLVERIQIDELFSEFVEEEQITRKWSSATIHSYNTTQNKIKNLTVQNLADSTEIVKELSSKLNDKNYFLTLQRLSACCKWAIDKGKIQKDPFEEHLKKITKTDDPDTKPDPFSYEAMEKICQAYREHPVFCRYADLIEFLFRTGFRTGEAVALQWNDVDFNKNEVFVRRTMTFAGKVHELRNTTKTKKSRKFPLKDPEVIDILRKLWSPNKKGTDFVFQEPEGGHVKRYSLSYSWHGYKKDCPPSNETEKSYRTGIVHELSRLSEDEGGIDRYRPLYNTRHTYITLVIEHLVTTDRHSMGNLANIASNVGNSTTILLKHYFGKSADDELVVIPSKKEHARKEHANSFANDVEQSSDKPNYQVAEKASKLQETIKLLVKFIAAVISQFVPTSQREAVQSLASTLFSEHFSNSTVNENNTPEFSEEMAECLAWLMHKPEFDT